MKKLTSAILAIVMVFSLTACGGGSGSAPSKSKTSVSGGNDSNSEGATVLKMATTDSTAMWEDTELDLMVAQKYFIDELPKRTGGRYEVEIFLDGQLASSTNDQVQGLKSGAFDICEMGTGSMGSFTDAYTELIVPYMYKNQDVVDKILAGDVGKAMMERAAADIGGIVPLFYSDNGFRVLTHKNKVITSPDDLKGVKIRVQEDPIMIATFEALGSSVVSVPFSELFTALQQKLVDAQENPFTNIYNQKYFEVQKTLTETNHMFTAFVFYMSEKTFNAMSAEDQQAVIELCAECQQIRADKMKEVTDKYRDLLVEEGMEFCELTPEQLSAFQNKMMSDVWPQCEELIGTERWNALLDAVSAAESDLGL